MEGPAGADGAGRLELDVVWVTCVVAGTWVAVVAAMDRGTVVVVAAEEVVPRLKPGAVVLAGGAPNVKPEDSPVATLVAGALVVAAKVELNDRPVVVGAPNSTGLVVVEGVPKVIPPKVAVEDPRVGSVDVGAAVEVIEGVGKPRVLAGVLNDWVKMELVLTGVEVNGWPKPAKGVTVVTAAWGAAVVDPMRFKGVVWDCTPSCKPGVKPADPKGVVVVVWGAVGVEPNAEVVPKPRVVEVGAAGFCPNVLANPPAVPVAVPATENAVVLKPRLGAAELAGAALPKAGNPVVDAAVFPNPKPGCVVELNILGAPLPNGATDVVVAPAAVPPVPNKLGEAPN